MTMWRIGTVAALVAVASTGTGLCERPEWQGGGAYVLRVDPTGDNELGDPGWGFGGEGGWSLPGVPPAFTVRAGVDAGNLATRDRAVAGPSGGAAVALTTSHNYFRVFAGVGVGIPAKRARVLPHAGVHLSLVRQDVDTSRFDPLFGEFEKVESDSDSGLGYDATLGLGLRLGRRIVLDGGLRYMRAPKVNVGEDISVDPEFILYYVGLSFRPE